MFHISLKGIFGQLKSF
uniref:Uncharacterized protein MANES_01G107600 n=1 Tax=Rhizophora mucronata TaxID=61149 RepID=A0A2P2P7Z2_RHIMU